MSEYLYLDCTRRQDKADADEDPAGSLVHSIQSRCAHEVAHNMLAAFRVNVHVDGGHLLLEPFIGNVPFSSLIRQKKKREQVREILREAVLWAESRYPPVGLRIVVDRPRAPQTVAWRQCANIDMMLDMISFSESANLVLSSRFMDE